MNDTFKVFFCPDPIWELNGIGFMRFQLASVPMPMETHFEMYELLFLETGEKNIIVEDEELLLRGGDLLIIHPGETHGDNRAVQTRSSLLYLFMRIPNQHSDFLGLCECQKNEISRRLNEMRLVHTTPAMRDALRQIAGSVRDCEKETDFLRQPRLRALLVLLLDALMAVEDHSVNPMPEDVQKAIQYIRENKNEMPTITFLAQHTELSEVQFKKKFKRYTGIPPAEYVVRYHVMLAQKMLSETSHNATQIAMQLGFSSSQHFARQFKHYTGFSPMAYRKSQRKEEMISRDGSIG